MKKSRGWLIVMGTAVGAVLGLVLAFAWAYCHLEAYCFFWPSIDTVYANGYSEDTFSQLKVGMAMQEVDQIMCQPLGTRTNRDGIVDVAYTRDGRCGFGDFAWFGRSITVSNGWVVGITSRIYYD